MKRSNLRKVSILSSLLFALALFNACDTVFAPKDPGSKRSNSTTSTSSNNKVSSSDQKNLDNYEKAQKAEAHRNLGSAYLENGRHNMAIAEFKAALKLTPDDYDLMYDLGIVYLLWGNPEEAIPYFENVLAMRPNYAAAINSLGNAYLGVKDYDRAISYYEQINDEMLYGTPYMPMTNMGLAYFQKGDYAKAEECYKKALKMQPDYINALVLLGQLQIETGNTTEAHKNLQKAWRIENAPIIKYYMGLAYTKEGNTGLAIKSFEEVMSISKEDSELYERAAQEIRKLGMTS